MSWYQPKLFLCSQNLSLVYPILESWYQTGITYDNYVVNYICSFCIIASDEANKYIFLRNIFMLIPTFYESYLQSQSFYKAKHLCSTLRCLYPSFCWRSLSNTANMTTAWVLISLCCRVLSLLALAQSTHLLDF